MRNKLILLVIIGLFLGGCSQSPSVAVLDMERLAEETGLKKMSGDILTKVREKLQAQLMAQQVDLKAQIEAQQGKMSDPPTQEEMQQLAQLSTIAGRQLQQAQQQANLTLQQLGRNLALQFRTQIQPHARRIAILHGMSLVLLDDRETVFVFLPETDITDAVIAEVSDLNIELKGPEESIDGKEEVTLDKNDPKTSVAE
ncbi:MAG: OmpH family outer membrane protein [Sedimenticola sp.]